MAQRAWGISPNNCRAAMAQFMFGDPLRGTRQVSFEDFERIAALPEDVLNSWDLAWAAESPNTTSEQIAATAFEAAQGYAAAATVASVAAGINVLNQMTPLQPAPPSVPPPDVTPPHCSRIRKKHSRSNGT